MPMSMALSVWTRQNVERAWLPRCLRNCDGWSLGVRGVLFIRADNEASLRTHRRMGMREVAQFKLDGAEFAVFSYIG